MLPRRRGLELSTLDGSLRRYLEVNPQLLERRRHYPLIRVLEFLKNDLGVGSIDDLLKCDVRSPAISLQKWVNRRVQETSRKTDGFEVYLARSFLSHSTTSRFLIERSGYLGRPSKAASTGFHRSPRSRSW